MHEETYSKYKSTRSRETLGNLKLDEFGFISDKEYVSTQSENYHISKWMALLDTCRNREQLVENKSFHKRIYRGVPNCLRPMVWHILSEKVALIRPYTELRGQRTEHAKQIDMDIARTFRNHHLFLEPCSRGQVSCFHILNAYAVLNPEIGYCQGMTHIVCVLLMYFGESDAFDLFVYLLKDKRYFGENFKQLMFVFSTVNVMLERHVSTLWSHMEENGVQLDLFMPSWFLTLFTRFDPKLFLKIWDLMFVYGVEALFCTALSILKSCEKRLMELKEESLLYELTQLEKKEFDVEDVLHHFKHMQKKIEKYNIKSVFR